jgi:hypothetical protein
MSEGGVVAIFGSIEASSPINETTHPSINAFFAKNVTTYASIKTMYASVVASSRGDAASDGYDAALHGKVETILR